MVGGAEPPQHVVLQLVKHESHGYNWGNRQVDLHTQNQLAEHVSNPLLDHMHKHLQHLPAVPHSGQPPSWVPNDVIYNDTGRGYHYPQPLRTVPGSHADNTLMDRLQHELQTTLCF